jgi:hypothetical protein
LSSTTPSGKRFARLLTLNIYPSWCPRADRAAHHDNAHRAAGRKLVYRAGEVVCARKPRQ